LQRGCQHVLIKGGHGAANQKVVNRWYGEGESRSWSWPRLPGNFHGSGCTLAAAVAALLACGKSMEQAIDMAQVYNHKALESSYTIADGQRIPNRFLIATGEKK
jgi:hydroxymethylpyrimidine/phosphomethylpyrimidine kinase